MAKIKASPKKRPRKNSKIQSQPKQRKRIQQNYSLQALQEALNALNGGMTLREAAKKYGVPKTTLHAKLKGETPLQCRKGPATILPKEVEEEIVKWVFYQTERGFLITKNHLSECVQQYVRNMKIENPFKNDRPGDHWFKGFINRHPTLISQITIKSPAAKTSVSQEDLKNWFSTIKCHLEENDLLSLGPNRILNINECVFMLNPDDNVILTAQGERLVYQVIGGDEKATVTVVFIATASGKILPPMLLFDTKQSPRKRILEKLPEGWSIGYTDQGQMTTETYFNYIKNVLYEWLVNNNYEFPVILYADGRKSYISLPLVEFCIEKKIELMSLNPNTTHLIQPLDITFFNPLKEEYQQCHWKWKLENQIIQFQKYMAGTVIQLALDSKDFTEDIQNGFQAAGLYPFNPDAIDYDIIVKHEKKNNDTNGMIDTDENNAIEITSGFKKNFEFLEFFEKNILPSDTLELFKQHEFSSLWTGDLTKTDLFECWLKMKRLCDIS